MLRCHDYFLIFFGRDRLRSSVGNAGSRNNHEHGRIVSVSELLLTVTPYTAGLANRFHIPVLEKEMRKKPSDETQHKSTT